MFNRTTIKKQAGTVVTPITQVTKEGITPDKVTEMYDKVTKEVERNFVNGFHVKNNRLDGIVISIRHHIDSAGRKIYTKFILNGEEHLDMTLEGLEFELTKENAFDKISNHYSNVISNKILREIVSDYISLIPNIK